MLYREFTKLNNFTDPTALGLLHAHALVLGFVFFILVLLLEKNFEVSKIKNFKTWLITYNIGLIYLLSVNNTDFAGLSHIAGLVMLF